MAHKRSKKKGVKIYQLNIKFDDDRNTYIINTFSEKRADEIKKALEKGEFGYYKKPKSVKIKEVKSLAPESLVGASRVEIARFLRRGKWSNW